MENEIYRVEVGRIRDDCHEEGSAFVTVTREANGYAVWSTLASDENCGLVHFTHGKNEAIEAGVDLGRKIKETYRGRPYLRDGVADAGLSAA